jgi:hypothetical protein
MGPQGICLEDEAADRRGVQRSDFTTFAEDRVRDQEVRVQIRVARASIAGDIPILA